MSRSNGNKDEDEGSLVKQMEDEQPYEMILMPFMIIETKTFSIVGKFLRKIKPT